MAFNPNIGTQNQIKIIDKMKITIKIFEGSKESKTLSIDEFQEITVKQIADKKIDLEF